MTLFCEAETAFHTVYILLLHQKGSEYHTVNFVVGSVHLKSLVQFLHHSEQEPPNALQSS